MSIIYNGTEIKKLIYGSTEVKEAYYGNTKVYSSEPVPNYNKLLNATSTSIALTEQEWIEFVNADGIKYIIDNNQQSNFLKKYITIGNTVTPNYSYWSIEDFNHDGSTNTVDLINNNTVSNVKFATRDWTYSSSNIRAFLINTFYEGFQEDIKNILINMPVETYTINATKEILYDKVKIPSAYECSGYTNVSFGPEGNRYPNNIPFRSGTHNNYMWTRSKQNSSGSNYYIFYIGKTANGGNSVTYEFGALPIIRFKKSIPKPRYYDKLKNATSTSTALTESEWIEFIKDGGVNYIIYYDEQSLFLKKYITISNSQTPNYSYWQIGDFNHDNTSGTVDLICTNNVISRAFEYSQYWANCGLRTWLNDTYYNGFSSSIKNIMKTMTVSTNNSTKQDKVKIPSGTECGYSSRYMLTGEGTKYPITIGWRSGSNSSYYWLRSRYTSNSGVCCVDSNGSINSRYYDDNSHGVVPIIRF